MSKKFRVVIYWGEEAESSESKEEADQHAAEEYTFDTRAELDSFWLGITESDGWNGCLTGFDYDQLPDKTPEES